MKNITTMFYFNGRFRKIGDNDITRYLKYSNKLIEAKNRLDKMLPILYNNVVTHYTTNNLKYVANEIGIINANLHEYNEMCKMCAVVFKTKQVEHFANCFLAYYKALQK